MAAAADAEGRMSRDGSSNVIRISEPLLIGTDQPRALRCRVLQYRHSSADGEAPGTGPTVICNGSASAMGIPGQFPLPESKPALHC